MNEKKLSFYQAAKLHLRGLSTIRKSSRGLLSATFFASLFKAVTPYVGVYLSAQIVGELSGGRSPQRLWTLVLIALISGAVLTVLNGALTHYKTYKGGDLLFYSINRVYAKKMYEMDFSTLDDQHTHDLRSQIQQNNNWSGWGLYRVYWEFELLTENFIGVLSAIALTVSLFFQPVPETAGRYVLLNHPLVNLGVILLLLLIAVLAPVCSNKAESYFVARADDNKMANRFFSFFAFIVFNERKRGLDVRTYGQQELFNQYCNMESSFSPGGVLAKLSHGRMGLLHILSAVLSIAMLGLTYVFVCLKAWAGAFGVGAVAQYVGAVSALAMGISKLFEGLGSMRNNGAFLTTTYEFLDLPNSMQKASRPLNMPTSGTTAGGQYEIEFQDVSFRYPHTEAWALRHVNMKLKAGERLAVVGENGSGKTTFVKLLCRLYDPQEGRILLNGRDIREYSFEEYVKIFSVAFQDFQLISQPLGNNVAAASRYDRAKVEESLASAGFEDKNRRMKKGLETCLYRDFEEDGVEVSGGEAQKIAIARALYKDAPFIILDEPTAALDPLAEAEIYEKFGSIAGDRTTLCISHRLSSCKFCDEILVFDHGEIVQRGSHEALLEKEDSKYSQLWYAQAQYYAAPAEQ